MAQKRILIIDDDPDFSLAHRLVLESAGYIVDEAADGKEGMAKMSANRPDLILMDVMMTSPLEGYHVTLQIAEERAFSRIPIVMISSIATTQYAQAFPTDQYLDIREFISKPVEPTDLLRKVKRYL